MGRERLRLGLLEEIMLVPSSRISRSRDEARARALARSILAKGSVAVRRLGRGRFDESDDAAIEDAITREILRRDWLIVRIDDRRPVRRTPAVADEPVAPEEPLLPRVTPDLRSLELALRDESGAPVGGAVFEVVSADGEIRRGKLDDRGEARVDNLPDGMCRVRFPELAPGAWSLHSARRLA